MGDLISQEVSGDLYFVPFSEFEKVNQYDISNIEKAKLFSGLCRINTLYMIAKAGSGHIGSSFSSMDILAWLYLFEMNGQVNSPIDNSCDIFFSSKGHDAPALYSILIGLGKLNFDLLHKLRRIDGLPGHPDISTPNIITNTGSLGMGISKAKGMIFANKRLGKMGNVFVLTGDGELQEGQIWESLISAANDKIEELIVIIDHNKLQSDTTVAKVSDLGDLNAKFSAFGWHVSRCDGNNLFEFSNTLENCKKIKNKPKVIIADTIKGKGVSFMEHTSIDSDVEFYKYHSGAPSKDAYHSALFELQSLVNNELNYFGYNSIELENIVRSEITIQEGLHKMIPAYSEALLNLARKNSKIIALDADLILDTGLVNFKEELPNQFLECGIAEQDMVSQAGGMALRGMIPVVHSFACFLSSRPNEQIYNNATEKTKIIYVGSLTGLVPAGPGHSHQAVRDIASLSSIPGLTLIEPCSQEEIFSLMDWAVNSNQLSTYMRLVSIPYLPIMNFYKTNELVKGRGTYIRKGEKITIITSGPIMSNNLVGVADRFKRNHDLDIQIIITPWLNTIDLDWYKEKLKETPYVVVVENHYAEAGFGSFVVSSLSQAGILFQKKNKIIGLNEKPMSGQPEEVLKYHKLDTSSLYESLLKFIE
ncbi:MAG: hypothetical protein RLZZ577_8 [Bacteroidota bacterium]|jgi:transketolase